LRALALLALMTAAARGGEDLAKLYPATMESSESGLATASDPADVWQLTSIELGLGKELRIAGKKAALVLGRHETNVLWAVVFPDEAVAIDGKLAGDGEKTSAIFLRFSPYDLGRLFPSKTVKGQGPAWLRARAGRIFRRKIGWRWSTPAGNSTIVPRERLIVDADTDAGARRFYFVDRQAGSVEYVSEFEAQPLPALAPITRRDAQAAFDEVWKAFDREYPTFTLLPDLDWDATGKAYRNQVAGVETVFDTAAVISDMLAQLEDLHVWVKAGEDWLPGFRRQRPLNASWKALQRAFPKWEAAGDELHWGRTSDGIGYVNVSGLAQADLPERFDRVLEELADTWAMVVDLRFNGGGDELLARQMAGRFADVSRVYSKNRYRDGLKHDQLGPVLERRFEPRGPWRYESPVVCLWGRCTMSSAESFALMMAQCPQVVTMGDTSAGSSANPRRLELACDITVNLPRWMDLDPDGKPIERIGIAPDVPVEAAPDSFTDESDPVLKAALERLRSTPGSERRPGRR
jgi:carboxyl-terminal processing protease